MVFVLTTVKVDREAEPCDDKLRLLEKLAFVQIAAFTSKGGNILTAKTAFEVTSKHFQPNRNKAMQSLHDGRRKRAGVQSSQNKTWYSKHTKS